MCNNHADVKVEELVNIQTGRKIDMNIYNSLPKNAMLRVKPTLWCEWDFEMNDELDIYSMNKSMRTVVWWICKNGHLHDTSVRSKTQSKIGCKICNGKEILIGYNDLITTNPKLASLLANPEDGYRYTQSSGQKVDWKCTDCGEIIKNKTIADINKRGLSCPICSDGIPYPEKVMYHVLKQLNVEFIHDTSFDWSDTKRYDFYIPHINIIIETHGGQHTSRGFKSVGGRSLEEEIENDELKEFLAKSNGIKHYIIIDTGSSEFQYIRNSILNSDLTSLFDLDVLNWYEIAENSQKSLSKKTCELWNEGMKNVNLITEELNLHKRTIVRYLEFWSKLNKCDYIEFYDNKRKIVQLSLDNDLVKIWSSMTEISNNTNIKHSNISKVCQGQRNETGGFKWMYKEDYDQYIETGIPPYPLDKDHPNSKSVVKLNNDLDLIEIYSTTKKAARNNNIKTVGSITNACLGKSKSAGGFKWMYLEDYNNMIKDNQLTD